MKKLLVSSVIFLSLVGTNCNAGTTYIITDSEPFFGSLIINNVCIAIFTTDNNNYYSVVTYTKDSANNYKINLAVDIPHFTKNDLKNVKSMFCEAR